MLADLLVDSLVLCVIGNKQFLSLFEALWMNIYYSDACLFKSVLVASPVPKLATESVKTSI